MITDSKKYILHSTDEDIRQEDEVVDNHNEDLEFEEPDYYSFWDDINENDD